MTKRPRFFQAPGQSFFLFGPRGTGKSTWIQEASDAALVIDLLDPRQLRELSARPERLEERVRLLPDASTVVLDEVQRAPGLLAVVHRLIEADRGWRFVLTGSSSRKLKQSGVDLLAGRALLRSMHPFMAAELEDDFDLERALREGMLPIVAAAAVPAEVLSAYAGLYLREEVQQEGLVRRVGDFARFLEIMAFSHGGQLNVAEVARECQVARTTVVSYLEVLEDLLLGFRLDVFRRRTRRQTVSHPKFYYFDCGVFRALRPAGPLDTGDVDGPALEGLVAQHLRAWIAYRGAGDRLYFWRTRGGTEVDFVVYGPSGFWAVEVKRSATVRRRDLRGLHAFGQDYPQCERIFLHCGDERALVDGVVVIPCEAFLRALRPDGLLLGGAGRNDAADR